MSLKEKVIELLEGQKFGELAELVIRKRSVLRYLQRLLYDREGLLRWRAIEGLGRVADRLAEKDPELVRDILRRQMWSVNDESGGIGWSAPEVMGEIIYHRPEMFEDFASIVISFLDEPVLYRGVSWAAGRIAEVRADLVLAAVPELTELLDDPDPVVRGYVIRFLNIVGANISFTRIKHLLEDDNPVPIYEHGQIKKVTIGELAAILAAKNSITVE